MQNACWCNKLDFLIKSFLPVRSSYELCTFHINGGKKWFGLLFLRHVCRAKRANSSTSEIANFLDFCRTRMSCVLQEFHVNENLSSKTYLWEIDFPHYWHTLFVATEVLQHKKFQRNTTDNHRKAYLHATIDRLLNRSY